MIRSVEPSVIMCVAGQCQSDSAEILDIAGNPHQHGMRRRRHETGPTLQQRSYNIPFYRVAQCLKTFNLILQALEITSGSYVLLFEIIYICLGGTHSLMGLYKSSEEE